MPSLIASLEGTIARLGSQLGVSWPNLWWPGGKPTYNDCAAFQSWGLFGLNGNSPYDYEVSAVIERSGLEFHPGNQGIRRGDLLGFRWSTAVNYDHIGMALGSPNAGGNVQSLEANGGGNDTVAIHTRNIRNVHNFARPNYTTTAADNITPIPPQYPKEPEMFIVDGTKIPGAGYRSGRWLVAPAFVSGFTDAEWNDWGGNLQTAGVWVFTPTTTAGFDSLVSLFTSQRYPLNRGDLSPDAFAALVAGKVPAGAGGSDDLTPIVQAIAALDKQADDYQAQVEAILAKIPTADQNGAAARAAIVK